VDSNVTLDDAVVPVGPILSNCRATLGELRAALLLKPASRKKAELRRLGVAKNSLLDCLGRRAAFSLLRRRARSAFLRAKYSAKKSYRQVPASDSAEKLLPELR